MFTRLVSTAARRAPTLVRPAARSMGTRTVAMQRSLAAPVVAGLAGIGASALAYYNYTATSHAKAEGVLGMLGLGGSSRFANRVAIITGGADGLGKGIAERLGSEGCTVVLVDFDSKKGEATAAALNAKGYKADFVKVDVSNFDSVDAACKATAEKHGKIDILVNCAGIVGPTKINIDEVDVADFDKVYAVNLRGSFNVTKAVLPHMKKENYGRVLLIASIAGKEGNAGMCAYSTSKAGVIGLVKAAGKEFATTGITINGLCPAVVRTAMVDNMPAAQVKYMTDKIPMQRCGTIEEVAATAAFIVSEEASFNTATCFDLTGGRATY